MTLSWALVSLGVCTLDFRVSVVWPTSFLICDGLVFLEKSCSFLLRHIWVHCLNVVGQPFLRFRFASDYWALFVLSIFLFALFSTN